MRRLKEGANLQNVNHVGLKHFLAIGPKVMIQRLIKTQTKMTMEMKKRTMKMMRMMKKMREIRKKKYAMMKAITLKR